MRVLALLLCAPGVGAWWRDLPPRDQGEPPYPYPATHSDGTAPEYATVNAADVAASGIGKGKINVHLVPHTHDDTGWLVTVDQYFFNEVYYVVDTVVDNLVKDPKRHFIYVETGFFARWWDEQPDDRRNLTRSLVANGQLEFINGAWCMHDEASPYYVEMVDQTTRGHQFLRKNFGETAIPRGTWQIDPFGHSNTEAWLLGSEAGFESLYWGRTDYQDMSWRTSPAGKAKNQWPEWVWQGSQSLGKSAELLAGQLTVHGYGAPISWNTDGGAIQDNPSRHDYNLDEQVNSFIQSAEGLAGKNVGRLGHQLWPCGSDFQYQNADHWFHNLDKIIHYVNYNAAHHNGSVVAMYSTPSHYTDAKHAATQEQNAKWEVRTDDVFPLGDNAHAYWSGYFTSRPSLKRQVRFASNFLNAARQMEVVSGVTAEEVDTPTTRPSPPVGQSWTDSMEGAIGVATHHDGMSGTEKQAVADDYSQRISEGHFEVEAGVAMSLQKLAGIKSALGHCNCNTAGNCLNMSVCAYTTGQDEFTVIAWNPLGQNTSSWLRIPVSGAGYSVTDLATQATIPSQATEIDNRTKTLPELYYRDPEEKAAHANKATHVLTFAAPLPPVGFNTFRVKKATSAAADDTVAALSSAAIAAPSTVTNGIYEITINQAAGSIESVKNLASGATTSLNISWGYYQSSAGGCTILPAPAKPSCSSQASGAYMFRPEDQFTRSCDNTTQPTLTVTTGSLVTEIRQVFASWATHIVRLKKGSPYIEVEWTAGPIPQEAWPGAKPDPPQPAPGGCQGWKQTTGCEAHGKLEPKNNKPCSAKIKGHGESGFCLCANNTKIYGSGCGAPNGDAGETCEEICNKPIPAGPGHTGTTGKELVLMFNSALQSNGTWFADSNGREMVKRQRDKRGPNYPPYTVGEPVAGNYYPVNSMISLDDGKTEMAVVTDSSMGGSSMRDGSVEIMTHRRLMHDDHRGVGEPLDETMCGTSGPLCEGLTMRGSALLVVDTVEKAHATRRALIDELNFPPTLAFDSGSALPTTPSMSAIAGELPENVRLMTITGNYAAWNEGKYILRVAHKYQVDEHPVLSKPATFSLASIFSKAGLKVTAAEETTVSANQNRAAWEAKKKVWHTEEVVERGVSDSPQEARLFLDPADTAMEVTINAMEVKTFLVTLA